METLPSGRQLTYGAYKDCSRPLRRCLKQLGRGAIDAGILAIQNDDKALEEVAVTLDIDRQARILVYMNACLHLATFPCMLYTFYERHRCF